MNIPVLIIACFMVLVVLAHVLGGTRETAKIEPQDTAPNLTQHWVQAMCAFQMLSVDLLVVTVLLFAVALWDLGSAEPYVLMSLIGVFCLWGLVWIIQMRWLNRPGTGLLRLPHWIVWFVCAGILSLGL